MTDFQAKIVGLKAAWQRVKRESVVLPVTDSETLETHMCLVPLSELNDPILIRVMENRVKGINISSEEQVAAREEWDKRLLGGTLECIQRYLNDR